MMGQQDPAPVNLVSGSAGWRRGLGGMLNPLAKTVASLDRPPVRRGTQIIVNRGGRRVRDGDRCSGTRYGAISAAGNP